MLREAILNFNKQFTFEPKVVNVNKLKKASKFLVAGMGGSHLAADLLHLVNPKIDLIVHSDYGLPEINYQNCLVILSSYSGNTEETLDAYRLAKKKKLPMAVITVGGKLLAMAKKDGLSYIELPNTGIQPRSALGFCLKALLKIMGQEIELKSITKLHKTFNPTQWEKSGEQMAKKLINKIPIIYSSARNLVIAYNWKIKFNENSKIPAFYNIFPELNHNEMNGFDVKESVKELSDKFYFISFNFKLI